MPTSLPAEFGEARELDFAMLIADLSGYTAFTETHGALHASEIVLRFQRLAEASLEAGVTVVNSIGDDVFCAGPETLAVVQTALRLRDRVERQPDFPNIRTGVHCGRIVERERQLFGARNRGNRSASDRREAIQERRAFRARVRTDAY